MDFKEAWTSRVKKGTKLVVDIVDTSKVNARVEFECPCICDEVLFGVIRQGQTGITRLALMER